MVGIPSAIIGMRTGFSEWTREIMPRIRPSIRLPAPKKIAAAVGPHPSKPETPLIIHAANDGPVIEIAIEAIPSAGFFTPLVGDLEVETVPTLLR